MRLSIAAILALLVGFNLPAGAQSVALDSGVPELPGISGTPTPSSPAGPSPAAQNPFYGGVPSGKIQPGSLPLSLSDAINRGLKYNLGLLLTREDARSARGARWKALADLLPNVTTQTSEAREQVNLAAYGFPGLPGMGQIVGPFSVFDTRAYLSQTILDFHALHNTRAESERARAADFSYQNARDIVVLVCANLYLQSVAGASRVQAAEAQVKTAQAIYDRAADLKKAGVVPGIDVLRAQVELQAQQQRLIYFQNEYEKQKLTLARAIGLPIGQEFKLTDSIPYTPMPPMTLDEALDRAYRSRSDYLAAKEQVRAAESARKAARGDALPSLHFNSDYGDIGNAPGRSHGTFTVAATLKIPLFQGGRVHGEMLQADARLEQQKSQLEDLRSRIAYEVRTAMMDLRSSGDRVQVAQSARNLANEQVRQAQDRFSAGVVSSIEVVQSEDALATADENYISSLYTYNVAKASLARALGIAEKAYKQFIGGGK
jgi:outer membrane protein TolC